jgi:hypothetical protein
VLAVQVVQQTGPLVQTLRWGALLLVAAVLVLSSVAFQAAAVPVVVREVETVALRLAVRELLGKATMVEAARS